MWPQTQDALRRRWRLECDEPGWCGIVVEVDAERQKVVVKPTEGLARERLIVAAQICPLGDAEPTTALRYNSIAVRGAIALEHGAYVLRELVDFADAETAVEALAVEALRLRRATRQQHWNEAVAHYAE